MRYTQIGGDELVVKTLELPAPSIENVVDTGTTSDGIADSLQKLSEALEPLTASAGEFVPKVIAALLILTVAFVLGKIFQWVTRGIFRKTGIDTQYQAYSSPASVSPQKVLGGSIGKIIFWVVMALAGIAALDTLGLKSVSEPLSGLMDDGFSFIPNLIGAGLIGAIAYLIAKFARTGAARLLETVDIDGKLKLDPGTISGALPNAAFGGVLLLFASPVLNALGVDALSQPITQLVGTLFSFIPTLFSSVAVLVVFLFVGKISMQFVSAMLKGFGVDAWLGSLLPAEGVDAGGPKDADLPVTDDDVPTLSTDTIKYYPDGECSDGAAQLHGSLRNLVLSDAIGKLVFVVIAFAGVSQAVDMLGLAMLSNFVAEIWGFIIPVFVGLGIFGVGYLIADRVRSYVSTTKPEIAQFAYYGVLVLSGIVGLKRMGFAGALIDLGFGAAAIGIAIALGLSFGLGGKEAAAEYLQSRKAGKI